MPRTLKQTPNTPVPSPVNSNKTLPVVVVLSTLLFGALCAAGYFYYQYQHSPKVADAKEIAELQETVGSFFMLPEGEEPTLATVTDREKLADQPFFQKAENGDKVLIYSNSGRAILYRPSSKKIVDVTTVNVNQPNTAPETAQASPETPADNSAVLGETTQIEAPVTVALYNGSKKVGLTNVVEAKITTGISQAAVTKKESARKDTYEDTMIVDVSGKHADVAQSLATLLGGTVAPLPEGETDAGTDLLVILGNDQE